MRQTWVYPGRFECVLCHNANSGNVLGFNPKQLHRPATRVNGEPSSQLVELVAAGVLAPQSAAIPPETIPRIVRLDEKSAAAELRVRSYLDVNCSPCHNPRTRFAAFDARIERDPNEQGIVDGISYHHPEMGPFARIVRRGDAALSMLFNCVVTSDPCTRMPPLATTVVDARAVDAIAEWILELGQATTTAERVSATLGEGMDHSQ